eukprot:jgi/Bigna1/134755/aug1.26_g9463
MAKVACDKILMPEQEQKSQWGNAVVLHLYLVVFILLHARGVDLAKVRSATRPFSSRIFQILRRSGRPLPASEHKSSTRARAIGSGEHAIQVMSDIDDTVKSSGGAKIADVYLGGIDTRYPRGDFYPGVFQFGAELSKAGLQSDTSAVPLAILTARAKEFKFALEIKPTHKICSNYRKRGENGWGVGSVLYGSVREWIFQEMMAERKFQNFEILRQENEREGKKIRGYVFIGDTGLYDRQAGEMMCESYPDQMLAVFLHDVGAREGGEKRAVVPQDYMCNGVPILHFNTYIGAAAKAMSQGLLDAIALKRVINATLEEYSYKKDSRWIEIMGDVEMAKNAMKKADSLAKNI